MIDKNIWKGRKVLITGHTGFKGSWLSIWLNMMGAKVIGYSLEPYTESDNFIVSSVADRLTHIIGDICDYNALSKVFTEHKPETVFHLAAQPLVRKSYSAPKETFDINIGGTVNVLECCRTTESVKTIINITTDKCYENKEWMWGYRENDRLGGYDPYSSSKAGSEIVTAAYRNSFFSKSSNSESGKSLSSVRAGNVIGGGDWQIDRLIPDCIKSLEKNEQIIIRNPFAVRPWQHVLEPLSGYLLLAARMIEYPDRYNEAWNFGPNNDSMKTVGEVADLVVKFWGDGLWKHVPETNTLHDAFTLRLDVSKARTLLGWKPVWNIDSAVENTVEWYKCYKNENMLRLCEEQIQMYLDDMTA